MSQRKSGFRRKTRDKISKSVWEKSKFKVNSLLATFSEGDPVIVNIDPSFHRGMVLPRFQGVAGTVEGTQGKCYTVRILDCNKSKTVIAHPAHLKRR